MRTDEPHRDVTRDEPLREELERVRTLLDAYIADREATEEALLASEERYRSLFERAAFGIYRATPDGRFLEANPALIEMLGYASLDELQRLDIGRDVYRDPGRRASIFRQLELRDADPWVEVEWKRKDGSPITVRLSVRIVRDAERRIRYCESIAEDITERRRKEELLRRHERLAALGTTLAGVAHELNNPLAAIKGFAQLLMENPEVVDRENALETIHRETERAARIVRDLLVFARRQAARERELVDLSRIVQSILASRRYAMETRGIACTAELAAEPALVMGDSVQLEQIVMNLLINAEHAVAEACDAPAAPGVDARRTARITLRTARVDGKVVLEVQDDGPGMSAEDVVRIWDPFWTTKAEGEGTGLGLSVVHGIVTAHGGTVEAESAPGAGMRVTVRLPHADAPAAAAVPPPDAHAAPLPRRTRLEACDGSLASHVAPGVDTGTEPLDILLVDDEASILCFLKEFLESRGHAVLTASDGEQALRLADLARFDVVLCDLRMPGLGGDEVIQRMRALPAFAETRFIISTGDNASGTASARIAALRPDAILPKPYDMQQMMRTVEGRSARARRHLAAAPGTE